MSEKREWNRDPSPLVLWWYGGVSFFLKGCTAAIGFAVYSCGVSLGEKKERKELFVSPCGLEIVSVRRTVTERLPCGACPGRPRSYDSIYAGRRTGWDSVS